jgi:ribulose-phosphate 3-epimerase
MKISVSILKEKDNYKTAIEKLNKTSCDFIHLDITDNTITNTKSFELSDFLNINIDKKIDIHIMSNNLDYQINEAIKLKPEYITFHYEATNSIIKYINMIKENGIKVGLAINPNTNIDRVYEYFSMIDLLLVMSVPIGEGGQEFIYETTNKLKRLSNIKKDFIVSVDGGINDKTFDLVRNYVDMVVCGSYITNSDNYEGKIKSIIN